MVICGPAVNLLSISISLRCAAVPFSRCQGKHCSLVGPVQGLLQACIVCLLSPASISNTALTHVRIPAPVRVISVNGSRAVSCLRQLEIRTLRQLVSQTRTPESYTPVGSCSAALGPRGRLANWWTHGLMTSGHQGIRGQCHWLPCTTELSHCLIRARSSVLHLTNESARAYPYPGPRLRFKHLPTSLHQLLT
jgi:hypothetical protein